ncbi:phage major capsid protein [Amycolatopsis sp. H20-H5]|uniref:phage major capsid protein n=1 Tax=Amycolatopsis sp. H20-H5 TaxID=3046309 RepID=UPI002DB70F55|nr:phage major capsid protein [Amycolatopsis sp. H20-H5]MEC3974742.1 phage major capsid protein [Amycolatopsis sp. H20-H5]
MAVAFTGAGWIPIETNPEVIQKVKQASAVERFGHHVPMGSNTKYTPRSGGVHLARWAKSTSAPADTTGNDSVLLNSDKIGGKVTIAEEDMSDSLASITKTKSVDAGTSYGKLFDNVCLGITVAKAVSGWGFDSLYYLLTQADTTTGYVANSNLTLAGTGGITYDGLSDALSLYEQGDFFDPAETVAIAHPSFAGTLRKIKSSTGEPIFNESSSGDAGGGQSGGLKAFGYDLQWSLGAKTSATGSDSPTGSPFVVFGNRQFLQVGDRNPLAVNFQDSTNGIGVDTDENVLYFRARKAFAPGAPGAFSMLVKN